MLGNLQSYPAQVQLVLPGLQLALVELDILLVELPHLLDLVEVHHKAFFVGMVLLDALPTEHGLVVGAVEVLDPLVMAIASEALDALLIFKVNYPENGVPLCDFIENIEIEGQFVDTLNLLDQLPANGAPDPVVIVERLEALGAKCVAAVDQYPGYPLADVELVAAVVAEVESPGLVVGLDHVGQ